MGLSSFIAGPDHSLRSARCIATDNRNGHSVAGRDYGQEQLSDALLSLITYDSNKKAIEYTNLWWVWLAFADVNSSVGVVCGYISCVYLVTQLALCIFPFLSISILIHFCYLAFPYFLISIFSWSKNASFLSLAIENCCTSKDIDF